MWFSGRWKSLATRPRCCLHPAFRPSAKIVSKAREDFPEPESPVITTNASLGKSTSMFFKLLALAPRTRMRSIMLSSPLIPEFYLANTQRVQIPAVLLLLSSVPSRFPSVPCVPVPSSLEQPSALRLLPWSKFQ